MATSPEARALNERMKSQAARQGIVPQRLRSVLGFQRLLARFAADPEATWVLTGGFNLEVRLGLHARATKDLDILRVGGPLGEAGLVEDLITEVLERDLGDGFTFEVRTPRRIRVVEEEPGSWRVGIALLYFRSPFSSVTIDVITSDTGVASSDPVLIAPVLGGDPFTIETLDLHRHAAEKFHAYTRLYAGERPSTRVKDLVDLVLLGESGVLDDVRLGDAIQAVFLEREGASPPVVLPDPPGSWRVPYSAMAEQIGAGVADVDEAWHVAARMYARALGQEERE